MIIKNAEVFSENQIFEKKDIYINGELIASKHPDNSDELIIDAAGLYAIPGLTDIHFHGCYGYDFCDGTPEALTSIAKYEARNGVTTICPATMSLSEEMLTQIFKNAASYQNTLENQAETDNLSQPGSILCGINMEGPFISVKKKGAQNGKYIIKPDLDMFYRLDEISGNRIKLVDVAPEAEGAMDFIAALKGKKVISLAHTAADYELAKEAFQKGASHVTHLYNAMPPLLHREPGLIGAAFDTPDCKVELICDGIHIQPSVVRATLKLFGEDRVIFISDSMMATGLPNGEYALGGQAVKVEGKKAVLISDGTIAGSATNLYDCMINAVRNMNIPLETAVKCAAVNPAKEIGIYDRVGSISSGKIANIVLMDMDFNIKCVILRGQVINSKE